MHRRLRESIPKGLLFLLITLFLGIAETGYATIINESFETGDLTGWQILGDASVQTATVGSGPTQGTYEAALTNDRGGYLDGPSCCPKSSHFVYPLSGSPAYEGPIDSFLGLPSGSLDAITISPVPETQQGGSGPTSVIRQTFFAVAGSKLSLDWNYLTSDGLRYDFSFVSLVSPNLILLQKLAGNDPNSAFGGTDYPPPFVPSNTPFIEESGFNTFRFTLPGTGFYTLGIGVTQVADESYDSGLLVDNVKVKVSEPSAILLLGIGLVTILQLRRASVNRCVKEIRRRSPVRLSLS
jgi:hypothetical protein